MYKVNLKFFFFWIHFTLFIVQQLALPLFIVSLAKFSTALLYVIAIIVYSTYLKKKFSKVEIFCLYLLFVLVFAKLIFVLSFNIPLVYWSLFTLVLLKMDWNKNDFYKILNQVSVVYLIVALLITYSPLNFLSVYEERDLTNRFFQNFNRFIGIEGTPAGPDLLYTIVLIVNLNFKGLRSLLKIPTIFAILVILWTSSLSNLLALVIATIIYLLFPLRRTLSLILFFASGLSLYVIHRYGETFQIVIDQITSYRATIWLRASEKLILNNNVAEWLLGRDKMVQFENVFLEELEANPHNLSFFILQFFGIPTFLFVVSFLAYRIGKMQKNIFFFLSIFLIAYSITNPMPFTLRGNPLIMYTFILCFTINEKLIIKGNKNNPQL